jgi:hypothetical protein
MDSSDILPASNIINFGSSFNIETTILEGGNCEIKMTWGEGKVEIPEAQKQNANSWLVRMDNWNCSLVKAKFIPNENPNATFTLSINLPGKGLLLLDPNGNPITSGSILNIKDFSNTKYQLDGDSIEFHAGARNDHFKLVQSNKNYMLYRNDRYERNIKKSNYINSLTGISSIDDELLQATDSLLANGIYDIKSRDLTGSPYSFLFSLYNYDLDVANDDIIRILTKGRNEVASIKHLLCLPTDQCESKPYELIVNDGICVIPVESNLKEHDLIIFDSDHLVEPYVFYSTDNHYPVEEISIENIHIGSEEYKKLIKITDNVFKYSLRVDDIDQIKPLSDSPVGLIKLFISKMLVCNPKTSDSIIKDLLSLEMGFGFMWFWIPEDIMEYHEFLDISDEECQKALTLWGLSSNSIADLSNIDYNEIKQGFLNFCQDQYKELRLASVTCKDKIGVDRIISNSEFSYNVIFNRDLLSIFAPRTISQYISGVNLSNLKELAGFKGTDSLFVVCMAKKVVQSMNGNNIIFSNEAIDIRLAIVYLYNHYSTLMLMITNNLIINNNFKIK